MKIMTVLMLALLPAMLHADADSLVSFSLEDPVGVQHTDAEYRGKVVVLIGSDRGGSKYNPVWGKALRDSLESHPAYGTVKYLPVADMRKVPRLMRGMVKKMLPKDRPVLLDWEGVLPRAYSFVAGKSTVVIFGADGRVAHRVQVTGPDEPVCKRLVRMIRSRLE